MYFFKYIINSSAVIPESTNTAVSLASQSNMSIASDIFVLVEADVIIKKKKKYFQISLFFKNNSESFVHFLFFPGKWYWLG